MYFDVVEICDAYESGIGHGLKQDGLESPYTPDSTEDHAYRFGYTTGGSRASSRSPVCSSSFQRGDYIRVVAGPCTGAEGRIRLTDGVEALLDLSGRNRGMVVNLEHCRR